ncbi:hypothetical protein TIN4_10 [Tsukamurella phage TIN4]|uniref:Uncharacterized protein n=2 Tax=Tinduovirus TIN3 TaxID=1982571 RepID=A0A0K0N5N7_9CAUD|nr:head-tail connector protein [Tsukamurella phage TIN3]YP_009604140.1 head-tail connector protein [Tsukamurella phage TIN4]AKJ71807.1 hypothetical protein TIN3_10 [Tsukamurella phage TIN3]AKJ71916.1 hypothetical protein TIN4_10 [Tsukamurella phage TIN4]
MADEVKNGEAVGRPNAPEPANKTDRVVFSDREKDDYARFGATPEPESASPVYDPSKKDDDKNDEADEKPSEESKPEQPAGQPVKPPTTPSTPKA